MSDGFGGGHDSGGGFDGGFFGGGGGGDGELSAGGAFVLLLLVGGLVGTLLYFMHIDNQKEKSITAEFNKKGYKVTEQASSTYNDNTYSLQRNDTVFRAKLDDQDQPVIKAIGKRFAVQSGTVTPFEYSDEKGISAEFYKEGYNITEMPSSYNDDIYSLQRHDTAFTAKVKDGELVLKAIGRRFP